MDGDQIRGSSSDRNLEYCRCRRNGVHYATIAEFLASLNINDTTLGSVQDLKTLTLEDYLKIMRGADKEQGNGDITLETRKMEKKAIQEMLILWSHQSFKIYSNNLANHPIYFITFSIIYIEHISQGF